MMYTHSGFSNN